MCAKLGISPPLGVSRGDLGELGAQLLRVALRPSHAIPETPSLQVGLSLLQMSARSLPGHTALAAGNWKTLLCGLSVLGSHCQMLLLFVVH